MTNGVLQKIMLGILTLFITLVLVFVLLRLVPSNPAEILMGDRATPQTVEEVTKLWGLDKPVLVQFSIYVANLFEGNAGISFVYSVPGSQTGVKVSDIVLSRLPYTIVLALSTLIFAIFVGVPLGVLSALKADTPIDHIISAGGIFLTSLPTFWLALVMIEIVSLKLHWLPSGGAGGLRHLIMPTIILSLSFIVLLSRVTRTEVRRVMASDYIRTARAKGLKERTIVWRHALRNAMIPLVTLIALRLGGLLNGAVVVESVFRWPGLGSLIVNSIGLRDYPTIQFLIPIAAVVFIALNVITDVVYTFIDPRIGKK